jgi:hypothetical protein
VGLLVAWATGLVLMSYLVWRTSRGRASVRIGLEATTQLAQAKVLGPLQPKPRTR